MSKLAVRLSVGLALALVMCGGVFAAPAAAPVTWQAHVGGATPDEAVQAMAFLPTQLTIDEGDTVTWTFAPVHTVSFLSGGNPPDLVTMTPDGLLLNPAVAFPSGGPAYDGTGFVNSGVLPGGPDATSFSLTFSKAGTYNYVCLLHPGMAGQVVVQAAGAAYPETQASATARGQAELYSKLSAGNTLIQDARVSSRPADNGTMNYAVDNGIGGNQTTVLRFLPTELTINAGDSVTWTQNDPQEIHTVTFYDPAGEKPIFTDVQPQENGPPKFFIRNAGPEGGNTVDKVGFYNSGIMAPGQSYTLTFSKPGTYTYLCAVHAVEGQVGTIVVKEAGVAPTQPAQLPSTGTDSALPLGWLAVAALLAGLLGLLVRRAARSALNV